MRRLFILLLISLSATAAEMGEYERQLIPLSAALVMGAHGTLWQIRVLAVYEGDHLVIFGPTFVGLPDVIGKSQPHPLVPLPTSNEPPGAIWYVPKEAVKQTHISARVQRLDATTFQTIEETPIPVVPESQFADHTLYFSGLVNGPAERLHVRIYSLDLSHPDPAVRVRIQSSLSGGSPFDSEWAFRYDETYRLTAEQKFLESNGQTFARRPLALELSLDPILKTIPEGADIAVSVLPAADGLRIWAMLSETNNVTQRVRLTLPR